MAYTSVITIGVLVLVYALSQALRVLVFEGVARQKKTIEEIAEALVMYAPAYSTVHKTRVAHAPPEALQSWNDASVEIRRLRRAGELVCADSAPIQPP